MTLHIIYFPEQSDWCNYFNYAPVLLVKVSRTYVAAEQVQKFDLYGDKINFSIAACGPVFIMCSSCHCFVSKRSQSHLYLYSKLLSQFSEVADLQQAESEAGELLDTYTTGAVCLAWKMITQIPPMIAIEPKKHEPHLTILQDCSEGEVVSQQTVSLRPILFFSYEGQVAIQGVVTPYCGSQRKHSVDEHVTGDS